MGKRTFLRIGALLLLGLAAAGKSGAGDSSPEFFPYRQYYYNFPHEVPPDYVYRTGRLFKDPDLLPQKGESRETSGPAATEDATELRLKIRAMTEELLANSRGGEPLASFALAVSTFVNLHDLYATSSFGRHLSEQLLGELQREGLEVVDVRQTPGLLIGRGAGEFGLSRDIGELRFVQQAQATVVGTYAVADGQVTINARILRNTDGLVLSSVTVTTARTRMIAALLADEGGPARSPVPVKIKTLAAD